MVNKCIIVLAVPNKQATLQFSLHQGSNSLTHVEVNHAPRSYVYSMGILYGRISTWRTEQLVNPSRRYVSATPERRL